MHHSISAALVAALVSFAIGCDAKPKAAAPSGPTAAPTATVTSKANGANVPAASTSSVQSAADSDAELKSGTPIDGPIGRIEGTVTFVGDELPKSTIVTNGTDPQICGAEVSKLDVVISPDSRGIKNVLLWLEGVKLPDGYQPPTELLVVDNVKCQFEPHAAVLTVGSFVQAKNSDAVLHTTHFYSKDLDANPGLPQKGDVSQKYKMRQPGLLNVKCDKHGWMQAYVRVDPHPFHAVSDGDGIFTIASVPVGTYKLQTWQEFFGKREFDVTVTDNDATTLDLKLETPNQN